MDSHLRKELVNLTYNNVVVGAGPSASPHQLSFSHYPSAPPKKLLKIQAPSSHPLQHLGDASIPLSPEWKFNVDFLLHRQTTSSESTPDDKEAQRDSAPPLPPPVKAHNRFTNHLHSTVHKHFSPTQEPHRLFSQPWTIAAQHSSQRTRAKHYSNGTDVPLLTVAAYTPQILELRRRLRCEALQSKTRSLPSKVSTSKAPSRQSCSDWDNNVFHAQSSHRAVSFNLCPSDGESIKTQEPPSHSSWQSLPLDKELLYTSQTRPLLQEDPQQDTAFDDAVSEADLPFDAPLDGIAPPRAQIGADLFPRRVHPKGRYASKPPPHQPGEPECMRPRPQRPKFPSDLYTPAVVRAGKSSGKGEAAGGIGTKEGWCGLCPPATSLGVPNAESHVGGWLNLRNSSYRYHLIRAHGISPKTYKPFREPVEVQRRDEKVEAKVGEGTELRGRCHQCDAWVIFGLTEATNFYVHASKCHSETDATDWHDTCMESSTSAAEPAEAVATSVDGRVAAAQGTAQANLISQPPLAKTGVRILGASNSSARIDGPSTSTVPAPNPRVIRPARGTTAALSRPLSRRPKHGLDAEEEDEGETTCEDQRRGRVLRAGDEDKENERPTDGLIPPASVSTWGPTESRSRFGRVRRLREGQMLE